MTTQQFTVPGVSCQHCVNAITSEVSGLAGVQSVKVDLGSKQVRVEADGRTSTDAIVHAINEAGYDEVTVLN
ncbi:MAG: heavy-metal-associated domain-containing protein [Herpetosiphonaceae bacterium]|nr:heavy-metal-associated domain-containing protein [Herpetosiphonaceae bacterium]